MPRINLSKKVWRSIHWKDARQINHTVPRLMAFMVISLVLTACGMVGNNQRPYLAPPSNFDVALLKGTWRTEYGQGASDTITIGDNGDFTQFYRMGGYDFKTNGKWSVEWINPQQALLHLQGARYFLAGKEFAELQGKDYPCPASSINCGNSNQQTSFAFYDPIGGNFIEMQDELILNIRVKKNGELVLLHMWTSGDRGYPIIGGNTEEFTRLSENN